MASGRINDPALNTTDEIKAWVRRVLRRYRFGVRGIWLRDGTIMPVPDEPAIMAKLIEVSLLEQFQRVALSVRGLDVHRAASSRTYPDIWLSGDRLGGRKVALEVKCARRQERGIRTQSRITLGPYDKYFRNPDVKMAGCVLAYGDFNLHLDIIVLYDYDGGHVLNVEPLVVETWRVASHRASSGTRNYIGAVQEIARLRAEDGDFATEEAFYGYWRSKPL